MKVTYLSEELLDSPLNVWMTKQEQVPYAQAQCGVKCRGDNLIQKVPVNAQVTPIRLFGSMAVVLLFKRLRKVCCRSGF